MSAEFVIQSRYKTNFSNPARFIISHILRHPLMIITLLIGAFSNAALAAAIPYYTGIAFNAFTARNPLLETITLRFPHITPTRWAMDVAFFAAMMIIVSQLIRSVLQQIGRAHV